MDPDTQRPQALPLPPSPVPLPPPPPQLCVEQPLPTTTTVLVEPLHMTRHFLKRVCETAAPTPNKRRHSTCAQDTAVLSSPSSAPPTQPPGTVACTDMPGGPSIVDVPIDGRWYGRADGIGTEVCFHIPVDAETASLATPTAPTATTIFGPSVKQPPQIKARSFYSDVVPYLSRSLLKQLNPTSRLPTLAEVATTLTLTPATSPIVSSKSTTKANAVVVMPPSLKPSGPAALLDQSAMSVNTAGRRRSSGNGSKKMDKTPSAMIVPSPAMIVPSPFATIVNVPAVSGSAVYYGKFIPCTSIAPKPEVDLAPTTPVSTINKRDASLGSKPVPSQRLAANAHSLLTPAMPIAPVEVKTEVVESIPATATTPAPTISTKRKAKPASKNTSASEPHYTNDFVPFVTRTMLKSLAPKPEPIAEEPAPTIEPIATIDSPKKGRVTSPFLVKPRKGDQLMCFYQHLWYPVQALRVEKPRCQVHYLGFDESFVEWIPYSSNRLRSLFSHQELQTHVSSALFEEQMIFAKGLQAILADNQPDYCIPDPTCPSVLSDAQALSDEQIDCAQSPLQQAQRVLSGQIVWVQHPSLPCWWPAVVSFVPVWPLKTSSTLRVELLGSHQPDSPLAHAVYFALEVAADHLRPYADHRERLLTDNTVATDAFRAAVTEADQLIEDALYGRVFCPGRVPYVSPKDELTPDRVGVKGGFEPCLARENQQKELDMKMPASTELTIRDIVNKLGADRLVPVIDCAQQLELGENMRLEDFAAYFEKKDERTHIYNVLSMEVGTTPLAESIKLPRLVRKLDWASQAWPAALKHSALSPHVQLYCLMSAAGSFTEFHIDFGGSSVFYHVVLGEKIFYVIRPTRENLERYELFHLLADAGESQPWPLASFADLVPPEERLVFHIKQGQTLFLPSGWIHAVVTPVDSIVLGGNFLHSFDIPNQLYVYAMEQRTGTPVKFQYPMFTTMMWFGLDWFRARIQRRDRLYSAEREGLIHLCVFLRESLVDHATQIAGNALSPSSLPFSLSECAEKLRTVIHFLRSGDATTDIVACKMETT